MSRNGVYSPPAQRFTANHRPVTWLVRPFTPSSIPGHRGNVGRPAITCRNRRFATALITVYHPPPSHPIPDPLCSGLLVGGSAARRPLPSVSFSPQSGGSVKPKRAMDEMSTHGTIRLKKQYSVLRLIIIVNVMSTYGSGQQAYDLTFFMPGMPAKKKTFNAGTSAAGRPYGIRWRSHDRRRRGTSGFVF